MKTRISVLSAVCLISCFAIAGGVGTRLPRITIITRIG